uniref:DBH-like monooxygenase protein 2 homolog isoform X2 n=1 Tax=Styela clava TaxID=7725 RepID=UPI0019397506|nr:DBH-like monooxygenase protein 2 homolog isoform X2 [Styela clava]
MRNGVELPYLGNDENYDFNYQEARHFNPGIIVKSTDSLQIECDYTTKGRTVMTEGGYGTTEEMCVAFVSYYPKFDLSFCLSTVTQYVSWPYLGIDLKQIKNSTGISKTSQTLKVFITQHDTWSCAFQQTKLNH